MQLYWKWKRDIITLLFWGGKWELKQIEYLNIALESDKVCEIICAFKRKKTLRIEQLFQSPDLTNLFRAKVSFRNICFLPISLQNVYLKENAFLSPSAPKYFLLFVWWSHRKTNHSIHNCVLKETRQREIIGLYLSLWSLVFKILQVQYFDCCNEKNVCSMQGKAFKANDVKMFEERWVGQQIKAWN